MYTTDDIAIARHAELIARSVPNPIFVTLSGSHLYGFSSDDSDWD